MAGQDDRTDGPSLELPSLRLRRSKQPRAQEPKPGAVEADHPAGAVQPAEPEPTPPRERPSLPTLAPTPATLITGLVVGVLTLGLVRASQGVCEVVRGTSSCGNAGFLLLVATFVLAGWAGAALLRGFGVADAGSTSALGMGLVAVVLMLFLGGQLFSVWMVVVVPVVATLAYLLAHRVTTAVVEPTGPDMHR